MGLIKKSEPPPHPKGKAPTIFPTISDFILAAPGVSALSATPGSQVVGAFRGGFFDVRNC